MNTIQNIPTLRVIYNAPVYDCCVSIILIIIQQRGGEAVRTAARILSLYHRERFQISLMIVTFNFFIIIIFLYVRVRIVYTPLAVFFFSAFQRRR